MATFMQTAPGIINGFDLITNIRIAETALFLIADKRLKVVDVKAGFLAYRLAAADGGKLLLNLDK